MIITSAILLSGGIGARMMNSDSCPKQYLDICGQPIINYSLASLAACDEIQNIVIVADMKWRSFIDNQIKRININKPVWYADPGETRSLSVFSGLYCVEDKAPQTENVIIHDAARPLVSVTLLERICKTLTYAEAVMPVLPIKDTCYRSNNGTEISGFIPRAELFAGQAPEGFRFHKYFELHKVHDKAYLKAISGSSELAYKNGMKIVAIPGEERNFKITTMYDLKVLEKYLESEDLQS